MSSFGKFLFPFCGCPSPLPIGSHTAPAAGQSALAFSLSGGAGGSLVSALPVGTTVKIKESKAVGQERGYMRCIYISKSMIITGDFVGFNIRLQGF